MKTRKRIDTGEPDLARARAKILRDVYIAGQKRAWMPVSPGKRCRDMNALAHMAAEDTAGKGWRPKAKEWLVNTLADYIESDKRRSEAIRQLFRDIVPNPETLAAAIRNGDGE